LTEAAAPPARRQSGKPAARPGSSPARLYLLAGLAVVAIATIVYLMSAPKEQMGPPEQQQAAGNAQPEGLPPGHPAMKDSAMIAAQAAAIEDLKGTLAKNPSDTATQLKLANMLYDAGRHSEAIPLYQSYLKANPANNDVHTDMALAIYQSGDIDKAMVELKKVLAADNRHQMAGLKLGMMYFEKLSNAIGQSRMLGDTAGGPKSNVPPQKHLQDSLQKAGYKDSMFLWLNHVVEVDATTPQGQRAAEVISALNQAHAGGSMSMQGRQ
jgi:cytochrome c-type biogenesis protein CcmH/NrfG